NQVVAGTDVTARPPDKARNGHNTGQLNLFLYHTAIDPAWRNLDPPVNTAPGETGVPALPVVLSYLVTAYGPDDNALDGHHPLGQGDTGRQAPPDVQSPVPVLHGAAPASGRAAALPGEEIVLTGARLGATSHTLRFSHPALAAPLEIPPPPLTSTTDTELRGA